MAGKEAVPESMMTESDARDAAQIARLEAECHLMQMRLARMEAELSDARRDLARAAHDRERTRRNLLAARDRIAALEGALSDVITAATEDLGDIVTPSTEDEILYGQQKPLWEVLWAEVTEGLILLSRHRECDDHLSRLAERGIIRGHRRRSSGRPGAVVAAANHRAAFAVPVTRRLRLRECADRLAA